MTYWLVVWSLLKNLKVSWDDEIPNIWKKIQTTNQVQKNMGFQNVLRENPWLVGGWYT